MPVDPQREEQRLGEILLARGLIDERQLADALVRQRAEPRPLGELLVSLGLVSSAVVSDALAEQKGWAGGNLGFGSRLLRHLHVVPAAPEQESVDEAEQPIAVGAEVPPEPPAPADRQETASDEPLRSPDRACRLFVPTPAGYRLLDWSGPALEVGATVELGEGDAVTRYEVTKLTGSPLSGAGGLMAYLQAG